MAKETQDGYTLKCPGCGNVYQSPFKAVICTACGQIAVEPVLTDGGFEGMIDGDEVKASKPEKKPAENTSKRPPESGGEVF